MLQPPEMRAPLYSRHIKCLKTEKRTNQDPLFGPNVSGIEGFHCSTIYHTVVHRNERTGLQPLEINVSSSSDNQEICIVMQDSVLVPRVPYFVPAFTSDGRAVACLYFEL